MLWHPSRGSDPLFLKIAPDLDPEDEADIAELCLAHGIDALIVGNTTVSRPSTLRSPAAGETGGLSGRPLFPRSTRLLARMAVRLGGRVPLIGVGGVATGADAYAKIRAGASAVQLYTALIYQGRAWCAESRSSSTPYWRATASTGSAQAVGLDAASLAERAH